MIYVWNLLEKIQELIKEGIQVLINAYLLNLHIQ